MEEQRDEKLWRVARKRAEFRRSLYSYLVINLLLWCVWWFTTGEKGNWKGFPWPCWVMLFWGIGLAKQYFDAYYGTKADLAEREYERMKKEQ
jgi:hypothetical protein